MQMEQVSNLFWADVVAREGYVYSGDVVSFDTTYLTNKCQVSFTVPLDVNSIIFICVLLVNETKDTFKWLFKEFFSAQVGIFQSFS